MGALTLLPPVPAAVLLGIAAVLGAITGCVMCRVSQFLIKREKAHGGLDGGQEVFTGGQEVSAEAPAGVPVGPQKPASPDRASGVPGALPRGPRQWLKAGVGAKEVLAGLAMAAVFALLVLEYGISVQTAAFAALAGVLLGVALVDFETYLIPNGFVLACLVIWIASVWFVRPVPGGAGYLLAGRFGDGFVPVLLDGVLGAAVVGTGILALAFLVDRATGKSSLGGGDVKLLFVVSLFLGFLGSLINLLLACVLGLVLAFAMQALQRHPAGSAKPGSKAHSRSQPIPFGPAIAAATVLMLLAGPAAIMWYTSLAW